MSGFLPIPSPERVRVACERFDQRYRVVEEALGDLFTHYHQNTNQSHVLIKIVTLNRLYSAGVLAVEAVAAHIFNSGEQIDSGLAVGEPSIVNRIARVTIQKRDFNFFSFATKYCSWHKPDLYPIYDSRVDRYLWSLQKHSRFSDFKHRNDICKDYSSFVKIMKELRIFFKLEEFTFKEIDKFLWSENETDTPAGTGLEQYLAIIPDAPPDPGDELPEGWKPQ